MLLALALTVGASWLAALAFYPLLVPSPWIRRLALLALGGPLWALPLLVPPDRPASALLRFVLAVFVVLQTWRMYDLHAGYARSGRPPLARYAFFLSPWIGHAVYRRLGSEPGPGAQANLRRLGRAALELALGGAALWVLFFQVDLGRTSFLLEHCAKWLALYPVLDGFVIAAVAGGRLLGLDAMDVYRDPLLSRTPAEFWRRYNRVINEFLLYNVFRRRGLRGRPLLGVLAAFAVSGLMHEYLFAMSLLRVQGYQLAFFMLNGVAVALTARLKPTGWRATLGVAATVAFVLLSLIVFSASAEQMLRPLIPFYTHGRPALWAG